MAALTQSQLDFLNQLHPFDPMATTIHGMIPRMMNPDPTNEFMYQVPYNAYPTHPFTQQAHTQGQGQKDQGIDDSHDRFVSEDNDDDHQEDNESEDMGHRDDRVGGEVDARTNGGQSELE
jgi:hypothetical protein